MNCKILLSALFCLVYNPLLAQDKYEKERLIRQKNRIGQEFIYEFSLASQDSSLTAHNFYDSIGNLIKRLQFDKAKQLQYTGIIEYNAKGLMSRENGYDASGKLFQIFAYGYDKDGHQTDYQQLEPDGTVLNHQRRDYNKRGENTKVYTKPANQSIFYLSGTFDYDSKSRLTKFIIYTSGGDEMMILETVYNSTNNQVSHLRVVNNEKELQSVDLYNDKDQLIETSFYEKPDYVKGGYEKEKTTRVEKYTYDQEGNKLEEMTWRNKNLIKRIGYRYKKLAN